MQAVMQITHIPKLLIDPDARTVFHKMVKEEFFLPWEARALDGLELPDWREGMMPS